MVLRLRGLWIVWLRRHILLKWINGVAGERLNGEGAGDADALVVDLRTIAERFLRDRPLVGKVAWLDMLHRLVVETGIDTELLVVKFEVVELRGKKTLSRNRDGDSAGVDGDPPPAVAFGDIGCGP